jgi:hypothetical protein
MPSPPAMHWKKGAAPAEVETYSYPESNSQQFVYLFLKWKRATILHKKFLKLNAAHENIYHCKAAECQNIKLHQMWN